jgi:hypothetical protein
MRYPASIVTDGEWGLVFEGHDLDEADLLREMASEGYCAPLTVQEVHFMYRPRVKNCSQYDGWGCDNEGEWHAHWFEVKPGTGTAFTVAHGARA